MILKWDFIAMEFDNMDICVDASWHVRTGVGFWMGVYDNWYFLWDDVHIVPTWLQFEKWISL